MLQKNEIFFIGNQRCQVHVDYVGSKPFYYISWLKSTENFILSARERKEFLISEFGHFNFYYIINVTKRNALKNLVNYKNDRLEDSPDFYSLEDLTKFVEILRNIVFSNHIKELILN